MTTLAGVKVRCTFISTAQLHTGKPDLLATTLFTCLLDQCLRLDLVSLDRLDSGKLLAEQGGKVGRLACCDNGLGGHICEMEMIKTNEPKFA